MNLNSQAQFSKRLRPIPSGSSSPIARGWSTGPALAAVIAAAAVILDAPSPLRPLAVLVFLCVGPGLSFIGLLGIGDVTQRLVLSIGVSLALDTIVAGLCLYAGFWSPPGILLILLAITLAGTGLQLLMATGQSGANTPPPAVCDAQRNPVGRETRPTEVERLAPSVTFFAEEATIAAIDGAPAKPSPTSVSVNRAAPRDPVSLTPSARLTRTALLFSLIGGCIMFIAMSARRTIQA